MVERNFTVIENETVLDEVKKQKEIRHTNPIAKKFLEFQKENMSKFSVKDLFKK